LLAGLLDFFLPVFLGDFLDRFRIGFCDDLALLLDRKLGDAHRIADRHLAALHGALQFGRTLVEDDAVALDGGSADPKFVRRLRLRHDGLRRQLIRTSQIRYHVSGERQRGCLT
jgi:hypothetical protein